MLDKAMIEMMAQGIWDTCYMTLVSTFFGYVIGLPLGVWMFFCIVRLLLPVAIVAALYLLWRIARNLEKPPKLTEEVKIVRKSLSETLKENRTRCKMTQEFVAETIGVSRQAVSKWENGTSEPNTSNLMALARLYGIPAEDLLKGVESALEAQEKES